MDTVLDLEATQKSLEKLVKCGLVEKRPEKARDGWLLTP